MQRPIPPYQYHLFNNNNANIFICASANAKPAQNQKPTHGKQGVPFPDIGKTPFQDTPFSSQTGGKHAKNMIAFVAWGE
jgi:hypothetical protein